MECLSCSTTVLDRSIRPSDTQHCHWESVHSFLLQWLCPAPVTCWRRSIIQSLCDHIKWCLQKSTHIIRYWIRKLEQKYEWSHSFTSRTMTISCLCARKFILQTCHSKNTSISQLPPCSVLPIDLWRRQYILTYLRKSLIWRWHNGSPLTQYNRRRRWWHGRTLPNGISWWWFLDGRTCSQKAVVHS